MKRVLVAALLVASIGAAHAHEHGYILKVVSDDSMVELWSLFDRHQDTILNKQDCVEQASAIYSSLVESGTQDDYTITCKQQ